MSLLRAASLVVALLFFLQIGLWDPSKTAYRYVWAAELVCNCGRAGEASCFPLVSSALDRGFVLVDGLAVIEGFGTCARKRGWGSLLFEDNKLLVSTACLVARKKRHSPVLCLQATSCRPDSIQKTKARFNTED